MTGAFENKVVLITGAGRGWGRAVALAFAAQGARVALNDISPLNVEELAAQITAQGGQSMVCLDDVAKKLAAQSTINRVTDAWERIDVLVNAANVEPANPLLDMDEWDWHRTVDVNLTGAFLMLQSVGRVMRAQGGGVMVNLVNLAGRQSLPGRGAYAASRSGLVALTQYAAAELAPYHIRVQAVCTGLSAPTVTTDVAQSTLALCAPDVPGGQVVHAAT